MAKTHVIDQNSVKTYEIKQDDSVWIVKKGVTLDAPSGWSVFDTATHKAQNVEFLIEGHIGGPNATMSAGIYANGKNNSIEIADSGSITGGAFGIATLAKNTEIINNGTISGTQAGIELGGENYEFRNSSLITTSDMAKGLAIYVSTFSATGKIINEVGGTISGLIDAVDGGPMTLVNRGTIADIPGKSIEVYLGYGDDKFVNRGTLDGAAFLGEGNDIADLRNGSTKSIVTGQGGNDIYIVNKNDGQAYEYAGQGIDTLKTAVSFTATQAGEMERFVAIGKSNVTIVANDLDNIITGNRGRNLLDGAGGDDILSGGMGADVFNFTTGDDSDQIMDFQNGKDHIDVSGWTNVNDFADIQSIVTVSGDDLILAFGSDDITIKHMKLSQLDATDFVF